MTDTRERKQRPAMRPLGYCAFTGQPMKPVRLPQARIYGYKNEYYFFGPFTSIPELHIAFSTRDGVVPNLPLQQLKTVGIDMTPRNKRQYPAPAREALTNCPYTGQPVKIALSDPTKPEGKWTITGKYYTIGGFDTKRHAEKFFSTRLGVAPAFNATSGITATPRGDTVETTEEVESEHGVEGLAEGAQFLKDTGAIKE